MRLRCCQPTDGFHQFHCEVSRRMRAKLREAGKPRERPDPNKRAVANTVSGD